MLQSVNIWKRWEKCRHGSENSRQSHLEKSSQSSYLLDIGVDPKGLGPALGEVDEGSPGPRFPSTQCAGFERTFRFSCPWELGSPGKQSCPTFQSRIKVRFDYKISHFALDCMITMDHGGCLVFNWLLFYSWAHSGSEMLIALTQDIKYRDTMYFFFAFAKPTHGTDFNTTAFVL